jgi:thioredoxin 1
MLASLAQAIRDKNMLYLMPLKAVNMVLRKHCAIWIALAICPLLLVSCTAPSPSQSTPKPTSGVDLASIPLTQTLTSGKPTLAEFGASTCIPCKEMKPILEELAAEYKGKLNVVIVEVYEHMDLARQYQIMAIPTQIFFDSRGREITRHMGLWPKEEIITYLRTQGID